MANSTSHDKTISAGYEPITGYKLEQLIGRGGFGEVWRSEAPGGLHKAVKFVFGATDEERAQRELRSLERIKGVHHPFLLTLERFGIVDERLVIVTELADGSLEEVYNRHRERGSCGIPRASLLSYLHDAADALDYLHTNYQLQHLDVKPGNLLLVGGHVKVGDFGLLKDLRDADCSMVGGLTPVYAPPELFDGRPSMHSDQYSLAVMYQELLTGTRPFGGRTIAQLATQHVHSAPNLTPLPASDRPVLARALEKDPLRRFGSCCEFIDALRATSSRSTHLNHSDPKSETGDTITKDVRSMSGVPAPAVKNLPQLKISKVTGGVRITGHSLIVAVGGSGAKVLHLLRERVASHRAACPIDLHSILIDTDGATIQAARLAEVSDRVPVCQSIHTPLKNPQEYRAYQGPKYKSISRRWLYNVPRSGETEAMRPLGRLALVDHGDEVLRQIRESIRHLSAVAGDATPHIYVVGSLDGGTGSGMVLDLVHLIRHVLDDYSLAQVQVLPLFVTGPIQRDNKRPLAASDAAATLTEMNYFLSPGNGYPGDMAANWPSVPAARTPLVDAYVIAAGLAGDCVPDPIDTVCEYIWADSTGAGEFFAAARKDASDESGAGEMSTPKIRSVGMIRLRTPKLLEENLLAPSIVRQLLYKWLGDPAEAKSSAPDFATKLVRRCGFTTDSYLRHCLGSWPADSPARLQKLKLTISALPEHIRRDPQEFQKALQSVATKTLGDNGAGLLLSGFAMLRREISARLSDGRCDLALAIEMLKRLEEFARQAANESRSGQFGELQVLSETVSTGPTTIDTLADRWLTRLICCNTADMFERLGKSIAELQERISDRAAMLAKCVNLVSQRLNGNDKEVWRYVEEDIRSRVGSVLGNLRTQASSSVVGANLMTNCDDRMTSELLLQSLLDLALPLISSALTWTDGSTSKEQTVGDEQAKNEQTPSAVVNTEPTRSVKTENPAITQSIDVGALNATTSVVFEIRKPALTESEKSIRGWDDPAIIADAIRSVRPALLNCGGCQRMLLIVGSETERLRLEPKIVEVHNGPITTTVIPGAAAMLVCEAQQIRLTDVHSRIVTVAANDQDVMGRLAARNDIDWKATTLPKG